VQNHLNALKTLHGDLLAALDAGDVERVAALVADRGALITTLERAFAAASPAERARIQPELASLLPLDHDLQSHAASLRDHLRADLDRQRDSAPRGPQLPVSGVVDRQA
jgi:hypothetical protein